ncbi:MAG: sigma-70 family RNA polymerase sigma factor [Oscillospiraceae bacterium]
MFDKTKKLLDDRACDRALLKISEGNPEALSVIYRLYGRMILSVAFQVLKNYHDAEDALQDVLLSVAQNADKYKTGTNARAWVMAITRNLSLNALKAKKDNISYDLLDNNQAVSDDSASGSFQSVIIDDALHTLSEDEQMIVKLKLYTGLSHTEIASVMNISRACAEKRYERAIKKLREYFMKGQ